MDKCGVETRFLGKGLQFTILIKRSFFIVAMRDGILTVTDALKAFKFLLTKEVNGM